MSESLSDIGRLIRADFEAQKRVLSFSEYLALVREHPRRHTRDAPRYLRDALAHFGTYTVDGPGVDKTRWKLFDLDFGEPTDLGRKQRDRLVGQQGVQAQLVRALEHFEREGRANRLILLHGPNGSAKSTLVRCLMRGLEAYSEVDDGALYRFSWIFAKTGDGKGIGFATASDKLGQDGTFAHLPEERIVAKMHSAVREHPLMLLPREHRRLLIDKLYSEAGIEGQAPDWVWDGQLGRKNQQIFDALLTAYRGDLDKVLAHVQVERFYVSRRYRVGAVTIGPQMAVDAAERQITVDRSVEALPASLSALTLFEPFGDLVDASGGIIEYSDLLKRPLDAWKYLLLAIEDGEVSLTTSTLPINAVMIASSNELHLAAFREHPEYHSFRGRITRVRVPYLTNVRQEQQIYDAQIVPQVTKHVAPHTTYVAALWAVLTRLHRPNAEHYDDTALGKCAQSLSPLEKADLLSDSIVPARFESDEFKTIKEGLAQIATETATRRPYEGLSGASPRAVRMLLLDAATEPEPCLTPIDVLGRLQAFCERDDYDFLKQQSDEGYFDHAAFVSIAKERWLDLVDKDVRLSSGLIDESRYPKLFDRYVTHVSHWVKKERVRNPITGKDEEPDVEMMKSVEETLGAESAEVFRNELLGQVAAYAIDHPDTDVDYEVLFPRYVERLRQASYDERKGQVADVVRAVLATIDDQGDLDAEGREKGRQALGSLKERLGYTDASVQKALGTLLKERYS